MELTNEFRVGVSVPDAWKVLTDVERIAPMLPGAQLQEVEGDEYRGVVRGRQVRRTHRRGHLRWSPAQSGAPGGHGMGPGAHQRRPGSSLAYGKTPGSRPGGTLPGRPGRH